MSTHHLELVDVRKDFEGGSVAAVDGVDLVVGRGETLALLGPSGCGKSTLLNMIVGLDKPTSGDILINGKSVLSTPAGSRGVGMVFQDYAVFPHLTVRRNLAFGLDVRGRNSAETQVAVEAMADLLGMKAQLDEPASSLGGSELQRVAIGRTLVTKPDILLLDEPLSNLEASARLAMRRELRRLQKEIGLTIIYVTHDQIEALSLASRIAVMSSGKIRQVDRTQDIYDRPDHLFVAGFLGTPPMNLIRGELAGASNDFLFGGGLGLALKMEPANSRLSTAQAVLGVRPETVRIGGTGTWTARVHSLEPRGHEFIVGLELLGTQQPVFLKSLVPSAGRPAHGETLGVTVDASSCHLFDADTGRRWRG
jgi:ABC-type sugar transport system ATPase subunit